MFKVLMIIIAGWAFFRLFGRAFKGPKRSDDRNNPINPQEKSHTKNLDIQDADFEDME